MSDRFSGQLTIGGHLNEAQVASLIDALDPHQGSLYPEWDGYPAFEPQIKQDLVDALDENGHIVICNNQARNGMFEYVENALTEADIPWQRWSESHCEYDAEIVWWHPGMDSEDAVIVDTDGNSVCMMAPVIKALTMLKNHEGSFAVIKKLESVIIEIPTLPKMEFV